VRAGCAVIVKEGRAWISADDSGIQSPQLRARYSGFLDRLFETVERADLTEVDRLFNAVASLKNELEERLNTGGILADGSHPRRFQSRSPRDTKISKTRSAGTQKNPRTKIGHGKENP
jgi:hypothetical protein